MSTNTKKRCRLIMHQLVMAGLTTERVVHGKHLKFYARRPNGDPVLLVTAVSPSSRRAEVACRAQIRRLARGRS